MDTDKLKAILKFYNIIDDNPSFKPLSSFANEVYLIETSDTTYILKRHLVNSKDEILARVKILEELISRGVNIPRILRNTDNSHITNINEEIYELDEYINHKNLNYADYNITPEELNKAGRELKKIHSSGLNTNSLKYIDFNSINARVTKLINDFCSLNQLDHTLNPKTNGKSNLISKFIQHTDKERLSLLNNSLLYTILKGDYVLIHGDYSLTNLLPSTSDDKLYITDWDGMKLAPRLFELQRAIGLLCSQGYCNANLDEFNTNRVRSFLSGYYQEKQMKKEDIDLLVETAKYCFYIYWLDFTLSQTLKGDYRILEIFPTDLDTALYWKRNFEKYREFLLSLI